MSALTVYPSDKYLSSGIAIAKVTATYMYKEINHTLYS